MPLISSDELLWAEVEKADILWNCPNGLAFNVSVPLLLATLLHQCKFLEIKTVKRENFLQLDRRTAAILQIGGALTSRKIGSRAKLGPAWGGRGKGESHRKIFDLFLSVQGGAKDSSIFRIWIIDENMTSHPVRKFCSARLSLTQSWLGEVQWVEHKFLRFSDQWRHRILY